MALKRNRQESRGHVHTEPLEARLLMSGAAIVGAGGNDAIFELLAKSAAYNETWSVGQEIAVDGADSGYKVDHVFAGADSFYALGVESPLYGPALVIQGSQQPPDFFDDTNPQGIGYQEFTDNYRAADTSTSTVHGWIASLASLNERVDITGHSLGAALTQWIASAYTAAGGLLDQVVTFNSPGISKAAAGAFVPAGANAVTHYEVNGDPAAMFGQAFLPGRLRLASFSDWNILEKHSLPLLNGHIGSDVQPANIQWDDSVTVAAFSSPGYCHSDPQFKITMLVLAVAFSAQHAPALLQIAPLALFRRDTAEGLRVLVGTAVRQQAPNTATFDAFNWIALALGQSKNNPLAAAKIQPTFTATLVS